MSQNLIGIFVFLITYFAARFVTEKALRQLNDDERGRLFGGFSNFRIASLIGMLILASVYFASKYGLENTNSTPVFIGVLIFYLLGSAVYTVRKLKALEIPENYVTSFLFGTLLQFIGIFVLFWFILQGDK